MLLNTILNSAITRQFRYTIFKTLSVRQYQSINIRFIECYLVPDHQEVVKYLYSLTFTMQISTTARQTSNCMQIMTYHVASFRTSYFPWFRVNTDWKKRIILCCIPDNCAIVLFWFGSISNDRFSSFENSTKFNIKVSQLIVQIYKTFHALHQERLDGVTSSCCSWRYALW